MPIQLDRDHYGESGIRLIKITRQPDRHDLKEISVSVRFQGEFEAKAQILSTDTIRNTVYALAKNDEAEQIEELALRLAAYFLDSNPELSETRIEIAEQPWARVVVGGKPHPYTFARGAAEKRIAAVRASREATAVEAGIEGLVVLKTSELALEGFRTDPFSARQPGDRILTTSIHARWLYATPDVAFGPGWHGVRQLLIDTFAQHPAESVQNTLYAMGEAVLESFDEIGEIHLSLPNTHCLLVDLEPFGLENKNEVFLPVDVPHGLVEAVVRLKTRSE